MACGRRLVLTRLPPVSHERQPTSEHTCQYSSLPTTLSIPLLASERRQGWRTQNSGRRAATSATGALPPSDAISKRMRGPSCPRMLTGPRFRPVRSTRLHAPAPHLHVPRLQLRQHDFSCLIIFPCRCDPLNGTVKFHQVS